MRVRMARTVVACAAILAALAAPSSAQVSSGRIDATVADSTGAVLPGVTVDIAGPQNQSKNTCGHGARVSPIHPNSALSSAKSLSSLFALRPRIASIRLRNAAR